VAKPELGTKRVCPETGRKFYDLNKTPVISPYTGKAVPVDLPTARARPEAAAARPAPKAAEEVVLPETQDAEFVSLEEADAEAQGKRAEGEVIEGAEDDLELDRSLDDAALIEEQEEADEDVTDIIGDVEDEEER
jgi:uncharacterized protein (TIGR02300 family)